MMQYRWIPVAALLVLCAGCRVGPRYQVPAAATAPAFTEQPPQSFTESKQWAAAAPSDAWSKGRWWEVFQSPELNDLQQQIEVSNQTLKRAEANFRQARALVRQNRSAEFPAIATGASITRNRYSA
ncbi:MAG: RND transporter, partial [Acidobacteriaceae bacterium]|nr:RND transporter [Acidobacteriaceae bacterium]